MSDFVVTSSYDAGALVIYAGRAQDAITIGTTPQHTFTVPVTPVFGTTLALGSSATLFGTEDVGAMVGIIGTDNVAACTTLLNSTYGVLGVDDTVTQLWQWTNGGASPRYVPINSHNLAASPDGSVYWGGRLASGVPGIAKLDGATGVADFLVNVYTQSGNQINEDNRAVRYADGQFWAMLRDTSPAMSHVEFNTTTGAEVRRELALSATTPLAFAYVGGLLITGESATETLWAYDPDTNTAVWSTNCNSALAVTTPSVLASGMNIVPSLDGTQVYVTRGGTYGGNSTPVISAFDVATGVELWEVDLSAAGWVGSGLGIYNGGVTVDKNGDVYVLCRVGTNGHIVRMTPAGAKVYVSSDQGITVAAGGGNVTTCLAVSDTTGIVYVATNNGQIHTVVQS